ASYVGVGAASGLSVSDARRLMGGRQREAGRGSGPKIVSVGVGSARRGDRRDLHHPHPETNHPPPRYGEPKGSNNRRGDIWIGVRPPPITATENTLTADFTKEDPTIWTGRCSNSRRRRLACDVQVCRLPTGPPYQRSSTWEEPEEQSAAPNGGPCGTGTATAGSEGAARIRGLCDGGTRRLRRLPRWRRRRLLLRLPPLPSARWRRALPTPPRRARPGSG